MCCTLHKCKPQITVVGDFNVVVMVVRELVFWPLDAYFF